MDGFSTTSLVALTSSIIARATSCIAEAKVLSGNLQSADKRKYGLQLGAITDHLQTFMTKVVDLQQGLHSATVISDRLQSSLRNALGDSERTTAILGKDLMRFQPMSPSPDIDWTSIIQGHIDVLRRHGEVFSLLTHVLGLRDLASQDRQLSSDAVLNSLIEGDRDSQASQAGNHDEPQGPPPAFDGVDAALADSKGGAADEPPPYSPPEPSSSRGAGAGPSSSPSSKGAFSWTESLKALTSTFRAKPDPLVSALCQAVILGDEQQISGFHKQGANLNGRNEDGKTPLQCAIQADQGRAAELLINRGADWQNSTSWSELPLLFGAASVGSINVARVLVSQGARADDKSIYGQPYFYEVVGSGNYEGVQFLLQNGADANAASTAGRPALVQAVRKGNLAIVELLLQHGADINASDYTGSSVLAIACDQETTELAEYLLERGAKATSRNVNGSPVLADAIAKRRLDFARKLLARGARGDTQDYMGQSVLCTLICDAKLPADEKADMVGLLLKHGGNANVSDLTGTSVLSIAMEAGDEAVVELLLRGGAKAKGTMKNGHTMLIYALEKGQKDRVRLLLEHGADANAKDKKGRSPLVMALVQGDAELVRLLCRFGADVSQQASITPAELAAAMGCPELLRGE